MSLQQTNFLQWQLFNILKHEHESNVNEVIIFTANFYSKVFAQPKDAVVNVVADACKVNSWRLIGLNRSWVGCVTQTEVLMTPVTWDSSRQAGNIVTDRDHSKDVTNNIHDD